MTTLSRETGAAVAAQVDRLSKESVDSFSFLLAFLLLSWPFLVFVVLEGCSSEQLSRGASLLLLKSPPPLLRPPDPKDKSLRDDLLDPPSSPLEVGNSFMDENRFLKAALKLNLLACENDDVSLWSSENLNASKDWPSSVEDGPMFNIELER